MRTYSDYGHFAGLAGAMAFFGVGAVCVLITIPMLLFTKTRTTCNRVAIGVFLALALLCFQFMFAVLYSFELMHLAGTVILSLFVSLALLLPPLLIIVNPKTWKGLYFRFRCCCFWKEGKRQQPQIFTGSKEYADESGGFENSSNSRKERGSDGKTNSPNSRSAEEMRGSLKRDEAGDDVVRRRVAPSPKDFSMMSVWSQEANISPTNAVGGGEGGYSSNSANTFNSNTNTDGSNNGWFYAAESRSTMTILGYFHSVTDNKILLVVGIVAAVIIEILLHVMLSRGCGCLYPISYTTWATRSATRVCNEMDNICHVYTSLGPEHSSLLALGHFIANDRGDTTVSASFCPVDVGADGKLSSYQLLTQQRGSSPSGLSTLENCTTSAVSRSGRIIPITDLSEDIRYVGVVPLNPLVSDTIYQVRMDFTRGSKVFSKVWYVRSLPSTTSDKNITFISGGDFESGKKGKGLLHTAIQKARTTAGVPSTNTDIVNENDARFASLGGDLAYENNIRYCYDRVDTVLNTFSTLQRSDGTYIPLLTAVGNHEAGGYLTASANREQRQNHYYFYPKYFPTLSDTGFTDSTAYQSESTFFVSGDFTVTYHHHIIGRTAWIVLDSGCMFRLEEQTSYLDTMLAQYKPMVSVSTNASTGLTRVSDTTSGAPLKGIVVVYHNPAFPSARSFSDTKSVNVREQYVTRLDAVSPQVRWVLEHHDHMYKRTKLLKDTTVVGDMTPTAMGAGGIVYSGDGSLGVHMSSRHGVKQYYHAAMLASNYVLVASLEGTGDNVALVGAAAVYGEDAGTMDSFYV